MNKETGTTQKIESSLNSMEGMRPADAPPFFYTRLMARMEKTNAQPIRLWLRFVTKPAVIIMLLLLFVLANGIVIDHLLKSNSSINNNNSSIQSFANDYGISISSVY